MNTVGFKRICEEQKQVGREFKVAVQSEGCLWSRVSPQVELVNSPGYRLNESVTVFVCVVKTLRTTLSENVKQAAQYC